jgi:hypothetical protein
MIVGGGIIVHNRRVATPLLEAGARDQIYPSPKPSIIYVCGAIDAATTKTGTEREEDIRNLYKRGDIRLAHPNLEHVMPLVGMIPANPFSNQSNLEQWDELTFALEDWKRTK